MNLDNAIAYDVECFPNVFTLAAEMLTSDVQHVWELSPWRDDRQSLLEWFDYLQRNQSPMIGFYSLQYDYPLIHWLVQNPYATPAEIFEHSQRIIHGDRFANTIWQRDRFAPQIDLFALNHFDNRAKTTSLKALEINMRSEFVIDMPVEHGTMLTEQQVREKLVPYNQHDTRETKRFAHYCRKAIDFRIGLTGKIEGDVLNFNDTKIGEKLLEQRLGELCYDRGPDGKRHRRQTIRHRIALAEIIFPYIRFNNPEFARVLEYFRAQVLTPDEFVDPDGPVSTKGVFAGLTAHVGGIPFVFGTGGIHASVPAQRVQADAEYAIIDVDVSSLYPSIAIVNRLAPAHLGEPFVREYAALKEERKHWQKTKGKKSVEANSIKLALNGTYGKSNSAYSVFYDPQFTMSITVNGQLLLCMLAERLLTVPTLQIIQCNTDGITYRIHRSQIEAAKVVQKQWEQYTLLDLEQVEYSRMWIRDVNNYVAETATPPGRNEPPPLKTKGAYWAPDPLDYADSISECQPPAWHKDLGNTVSIRAAVAAMTQGIDPEWFIRLCTNPFDFMLRIKVDRSSKLILGGITEIQRTSRYYVSTCGEEMTKVSPPVGQLGAFKRKNGVSEYEYQRVMRETGGEWSELVCTKNRSRYENRTTAIQAGFKVRVCNDAAAFNFADVDYSYYVAEARKLIIS